MPNLESSPCPSDMVPASPALLAFDYDAAAFEGWTIMQTGPRPDGTPTVVIIRIINPDRPERRFRDDESARRYVVERALKGSLLHRQAVSLVDRYERFVSGTLHGLIPDD